MRPVATHDPKKLEGVIVNAQDKEPAGIYTATITYDDSYPAAWEFTG